jgi:hypothetical protein
MARINFIFMKLRNRTLLPRPGPTLVTVQPDEVWNRFTQGGEFVERIRRVRLS